MKPVHAGDELTASILVPIKVLLVTQSNWSKEDGTIIVIGDYIVISPGSRDVAASFIPYYRVVWILNGVFHHEWRN